MEDKKKMKIKGLHKFISEVNDPKSATTSEYRIQLELMKIKKSLLKKKKKKMYNTKKCVAKLCYIELYGCHVTFGFPQILDLLRSTDLSDNFFGCLATVILAGNNEAFISQLIPEMRRLLNDSTNDLGICFALNAISCIDNAELADSLGPSIADIVIQPNVSDYARKKAMLALSKIYQSARQYPSIDRITAKLSSFLNSKSTGVTQCAATLILSIIQSQAASIIDFFPIAINQLYLIFIKNEYNNDMLRGKIPCPFLVTKLFRLLYFKSDWTETEKEKIESVVKSILDLVDFLIGPPHSVEESIPLNSPLTTQISPSNGANNQSSLLPSYMIFWEMANLAASVPLQNESMERIIQRLLNLIEIDQTVIAQNPISILHSDDETWAEAEIPDSPPVKEFDLCLFSLDKLNLIVRSVPLCASLMQPVVPFLLKMIKTRNILVDARALDLLYAIATSENGVQIATEMIDFFPDAPLHLRESLCNKSAVLVQSYGQSDIQSVLLLVKILKVGGKSLSRTNSIWRFVVQTVDQKPALRKEVTEDVYASVTSEDFPQAALINLASFLIGEYFDLCETFSAQNAVDELIEIFKDAEEQGQPMIATALMKIVAKAGDVKQTVTNFFRRYAGSLCYEVAQRCREFLKLLSFPEKVLKKVIVSSYSNRHIVSDVFAQNTVVGEMPQIEEKESRMPQFEERFDLTIDDKLFNEFQNDDTGILLKSLNFIIRAAVRYDQPRLSMIVNIENLTSAPIVIKNFTIDSNDELRYRIVDIPFSIESQSRSSISIDFVMMEMTNRFPILNLTIEKRAENGPNNDVPSEKVETVSTPLPIFFNKWFTPFVIDEDSFRSRWSSIVDPLLVGEAQLMIPDGDVMDVTTKVMKKLFGLEPLNFEIADNNLAYAGAFKCFSGNIGVLIRFVYFEDKMDFSFQVKVNMKSAVKVIVEMIRTAFLS